MRPLPGNLLLLLAAVLVTVLAATSFGLLDEKSVPYSEFKSMVADGRIASVTFDGDSVVGTLAATASPSAASGSAAPDDASPPTQVHSVRVPGDESLVPLLEQKGLSYRASAQTPGCGSGSFLMTMALTAGLWMLLSRPNGGVPPGIATFGKSQAKLAPEEGIGVTFKDVAGIDEAAEELQEIVQFLRTPERFTRLGGRIPKGVLLVGPPGTGKTLLARAVAGEAKVPFYSLSGSDFVEMFVGVGASRVRDLFKQAGERAPCIVFIDELDAIGKARGASGPVGGHDEREQTLNQLLVEMDGFDGRKGIIVMAATNRPETLDPALLRAGRFDRQVVVDRPDVKGREAILRVHAERVKLATDVDLRGIAQRTPGFSGADLANALNEAALLAARKGRDEVHQEEIYDAVERLVAGLEKKSRRLSEKERRVVATHEAGHAIVAAASAGSDPVQKISIIPRGVGALGYTMTLPAEDRYLVSRTELRSRLAVLYGGRAAEELVFGDMTTGAGDDIQKASDLARRMVTQFGMSERLGAVNYGAERANPFGVGGASRDVVVSDATADAIDLEVRQVLDAAQAEARTSVARYRGLLDRMAEHLLEHEVLDGPVLDAFLAEARPDGVVVARVSEPADS
jgi:cell division protease FtsH